MSEELQAQFKTEGQPAFEPENTEKDNSASSPEDEKTDTEQTQSQEGETNSGVKKDDGEKDGFQNHPAWKEREKKWDSRFNEQEERHVSELKGLRTEFEEKINSRVKPEESNLPEDIPAWFGGDESQWKQYRRDQKAELDATVKRAKEEALKEVDSRSQGENKAIDEATKFFRSEVEFLEETTGEKIDRNKLLKFVLDNDLVDTKGRWNYKAGYRLMKSETAKPKIDNLTEKKKLANGTVEGGKPEAKNSEFMTNEDFQKPGNRPW